MRKKNFRCTRSQRGEFEKKNLWWWAVENFFNEEMEVDHDSVYLHWSRVENGCTLRSIDTGIDLYKYV